MTKYFLLSLLLPFSTIAYQPTNSNFFARKDFSDARFGLFIHWGIYSQLAHGEWVMEMQRMSLENYEQLAPMFNPVKFDAAQWVAIAKAAGMKYITITAKHHDGFAMFGTKQNKWNIVDSTFYGQDVLKQLADECHKQGIKLFFYYSQLDWHHPDYFPRGYTGNRSSMGRPNRGDWSSYIQFMNAQLTELLTNYGEIAGIWFDGYWDNPTANWDLENTFNLIHSLQPHALIGSNHHGSPFDGQDFQMFEQDLPGENAGGFEAETKISALPLESCVTINEKSWGVDLVDKSNKFKTTKELVQTLAGAAGRGANLLLNVGPLADGTFPQKAVKLLHEVGAWLKIHGESIYGTTKGPLTPRSWGVTTQRDNRIYVHLLNWNTHDELWLPLKNVKKGHYLANQKGAKFENVDSGILLKNIELVDPYDTILVLTIEI